MNPDSDRKNGTDIAIRLVTPEREGLSLASVGLTESIETREGSPTAAAASHAVVRERPLPNRSRSGDLDLQRWGQAQGLLPYRSRIL